MAKKKKTKKSKSVSKKSIKEAKTNIAESIRDTVSIEITIPLSSVTNKISVRKFITTNLTLPTLVNMKELGKIFRYTS
ncbi:MAG: hypothetical protein IKF11_10850, partial [Methanobrevibacter sp.]|nr:hypothetical protein [Methanobrevibacter sp.]